MNVKFKLPPKNVPLTSESQIILPCLVVLVVKLSVFSPQTTRFYCCLIDKFQYNSITLH